MAEAEEQPQVTYEELAAVEDEFEEIDTEMSTLYRTQCNFMARA